MVDGFKETLSQINKITWTVLALAISILIFNPSNESINILGISVDGTRSFFIIPIAIAGLLVMKQIMIRNIVEIIKHTKNKTELKDIVMSYPIIEFMRWKFDSSNETMLLSILQMFIDVLPALALILYKSILENSGFTISNMYTVTSFIVLFLAIWNYRTLRKGVFEQLVGKIKTPD